MHKAFLYTLLVQKRELIFFKALPLAFEEKITKRSHAFVTWIPKEKLVWLLLYAEPESSLRSKWRYMQ